MDHIVDKIKATCNIHGTVDANIVCKGSPDCAWDDSLCLDGCPRAELQCTKCDRPCELF